MNKLSSSIYLWNANRIKFKINELEEFLIKNNRSIFAINETKLNKNEENIFEKLNYNYVCNSRNNRGGGVAILIEKEIVYEEVFELDRFKVEQVSIKIKTNNSDLYIISYYNPPNESVNSEMLKFIDDNFKNYVICGDLNSRSKSFGCFGNNNNGEKLSLFLENSSAI
jgi:exonuclease III